VGEEEEVFVGGFHGLAHAAAGGEGGLAEEFGLLVGGELAGGAAVAGEPAAFGGEAILGLLELHE